MKKRKLFDELKQSLEEFSHYDNGKLTLRTHQVKPMALPEVTPELVRDTREAMQMSRGVFARYLHVSIRTLENWEQGRSRPNEQAATLILLVRHFPDTLTRLQRLAA
jgi:putative transcriptional regulator